jgi:hypothetical protein
MCIHTEYPQFCVPVKHKNKLQAHNCIIHPNIIQIYYILISFYDATKAALLPGGFNFYL